MDRRKALVNNLPTLHRYIVLKPITQICVMEIYFGAQVYIRVSHVQLRTRATSRMSSQEVSFALERIQTDTDCPPPH